MKASSSPSSYLRLALQMLGISQDTVSEEDFLMLIRHFDADKSGEIDGPEFQTLVQVCAAQQARA